MKEAIRRQIADLKEHMSHSTYLATLYPRGGDSQPPATPSQQAQAFDADPTPPRGGPGSLPVGPGGSGAVEAGALVPQSVLDALAVWLPVPGWTYYEVSDLGDVRRCVAVDTTGRRVAIRVLRPRITDEGYAMVSLREGKRQRSFRVHTLVLRAFVGEPTGREANHKDGLRSNNALANLEWLTHAENIRATYAAGRGVQQQPGYLNPMRAEAREARRRAS